MNNKGKNKRDKRLHKGESQRPDGRYQYRYTDADGKTHYEYAWRLTESDVTPPGKKQGKPLRVIEREIQDAVAKNIKYSEIKKLTLDDLFDRWLPISGSDEDTKYQYIRNYDRYFRDTLGKRKVTELKPSDFQQVIMSMLKTHERSSVKTALIPVIGALNSAVDDELISRNVASIAQKNSCRGKDTSGSAPKSLTPDQAARFMEFIKNSERYSYWYPFFVLLTDTGCRVGEICGLAWSDIDWRNKCIHINRSLEYYPRNGKYQRCIKLPKTKAGIRTIPMTPAVHAALTKLHLNMRRVEPVEGIEDFIFCNRLGRSVIRNEINQLINKIVEDYNKTTREDNALPHIHPHMERHTLASNLLGVCHIDVKTVQLWLGHSSPVMTLNYAEPVEHNDVEAIEKYSHISPTYTAVS